MMEIRSVDYRIRTVNWKPPELFRKGGEATRASDMYSCACVMYELASGCIPWDGEGPANIVGYVTNGERPASQPAIIFEYNFYDKLTETNASFLSNLGATSTLSCRKLGATSTLSCFETFVEKSSDWSTWHRTWTFSARSARFFSSILAPSTRPTSRRARRPRSDARSTPPRAQQPNTEW